MKWPRPSSARPDGGFGPVTLTVSAVLAFLLAFGGARAASGDGSGERPAKATTVAVQTLSMRAPAGLPELGSEPGPTAEELAAAKAKRKEKREEAAQRREELDAAEKAREERLRLRAERRRLRAEREEAAREEAARKQARQERAEARERRRAAEEREAAEPKPTPPKERTPTTTAPQGERFDDSG